MLGGRGSQLVLVLLLCVLQKASAQGRCVEGLCSFQEPLDFHGAGVFCEALNWKLLESKDLGRVAKLLKGLSGRFWVGPTQRMGHCPAVSVTHGQNVTALSVPCQDKLDGHVCQYAAEEGCTPLHAGKGEEVKYITQTGDKLLGSEEFPPGTLALVRQDKHLCFSSWIKAPWNCEVLNGGCEHKCDPAGTDTCTCPQGQILRANKYSCVLELCAECEYGCTKKGSSYVCMCEANYRLDTDGKRCVDVDECMETPNVCTRTGEVCVNQKGGYKCECASDFVEEDGACVNTSICFHCEHRCEKVKGVYVCVCAQGFRVSITDPTKCVRHCGRSECAAACVRTADMQQCFCPEGYISGFEDQNALCYDIDECMQQKLCEHVCVNTYGSYVCACDEGFVMDGSSCVRMEDEDEVEQGSSSTAELMTPDWLLRVPMPPYVKVGSVLGILMFLLLGTGLLCLLIKRLRNRCRTLTLTPLKHAEINIFHLQQVTMATTETYKRLSFDKQSKNESQR